MEIHDLRNNTFFANIQLLHQRECRSSSMPVPATRSPSPCAPVHRSSSMTKVIEKSRNVDFGTKMTDLDRLKKEKLAEFLENLSPEDFGKYKM